MLRPGAVLKEARLIDEEGPGPAYPGGAPHSRGRFTDTSWFAARSIPEDRLNQLQVRTLNLLRERGDAGATNEEASEMLGEYLYTIAPRVRELVLHGLVVDSGMRRPSSRNRPMIVWTYTPGGEWTGDDEGHEF